MLSRIIYKQQNLFWCLENKKRKNKFILGGFTRVSVMQMRVYTVYNKWSIKKDECNAQSI